MAKLRLLFIKEEQAAWISHLDLIRTFQRAFPRAGIPLRHSNGYHPHALLSAMLPLPVGQSSVCELLDFEPEDGAEVSIERLNESLPSGLRARAVYEGGQPARRLHWLRALVTFEYDAGAPPLDALRALFARETLCIEKRTKRQALARVDLIPLIHDIEWERAAHEIRALATVRAQNPGLNPALLARAAGDNGLAPDFTRVRRLEVYDEAMNVFR